MSLGLVSVVMPTHNKGRYIRESIDSVVRQTYEDWELIVVDDGSTDDTEVILKQYTDNRIRVYRNEINRGAAYSRNLALNKARGKWVAFLDSDDVWYEEKLRMQLEFMCEHHYKFTYHEYEEIEPNGRSRRIKVSGKKRVAYKDVKRCCWMGCLTVMYDADYIGKLHTNEAVRNNDMLLWLTIAKRADCYLMNKCLAKYRQFGREGIKERIVGIYRLYYNEGIVGRGVAWLWTVVCIVTFGIKKVFYTQYGFDGYDK